MAASFRVEPDPVLDLVLERVVPVRRELVWAAWTTPAHICKWFTPAPWTVTACEIDLRPGGAFRTVFRSPEGQEFPNSGCYLEIVPLERLVWTDALRPGFRPAPEPFITASVSLETVDGGTRYTAHVMHASEAACRKHAEMGFHAGWGTALDQLVALARTL